MSPAVDSPAFLFAGCQVGAETALKTELAGNWPSFRFAFSRPGFLTFKLPPQFSTDCDFDLRSTFARCSGWTFDKIDAVLLSERIDSLRDFLNQHGLKNLHIWPRQVTPAGDRRGVGDRITKTVEEVVAETRKLSEHWRINEIVRPGALVADCILIEPDQWWLGMHQANSVSSRWPGGAYPGAVPSHAVSRAYIKVAEALAWSRLPFKRNDLSVELGSAPGGSSQYLLEHGLQVIGVDPAEMHPDVLAHPHFRHWRCRGRDVKRREFQGVRWLFADSNVAPQYTLDTVEDIVTHRLVNVHGMLLTLKLLDWSLTSELSAHMARIRGWGYDYVKARQLSHGGQEVCLFALRQRSMLRRRKAVKPTRTR